MKVRINELKPVFVEFIPNEKEEGILYISERFRLSVHLCACGCREQTVLPFGREEGGWDMVNNNGLVSLSPSIGNFSGENPYHAHYFITENKIIWL